jgi:hypothetical protein
MANENVPVNTLWESGLEGVCARTLDYIDERAWVKNDLRFVEAIR